MQNSQNTLEDINELIGKNTGKSNPEIHLNIENELINYPKIVPETFNEYYIPNNIRNKLPPTKILSRIILKTGLVPLYYKYYNQLAGLLPVGKIAEKAV